MNKKKNGGYGCGSIVAILVICAFLMDVLPIVVALVIIAIIILGVRNNISKQKKLEKSKEAEPNYMPDSELKDSIQRKNEVISAQNFEISDKKRRIKELERQLEREKEENTSDVKERRLSRKTYISHIDAYFDEAGRLVIDKNKASVGMLQREFKIGFNRAARIMDELCEAGVVGEEIGTTPRKVLMNRDEFEELLNNGIEAREDDISNSQSGNQQEISSTLNRIDMYNNQYDYMTGEDFETYIAMILQRIGYGNIQLTKGSGDQGVDIIAEKDGMKYAFQCKRYDKPVGNKAVQEVFAGKFFYHCHAAVVVTNNYFTQSAKDLAHENGVVLWDRTFLERYATNETNIKEQENYESDVDKNDLRNTCMIITAIIIGTYKSYHIYVKFADFRFENGNAVFGVLPMPGTRVSEVLGFQKELSLKLGANIKIEIISERGYIGICMPLLQFKKRMEEMLNDDGFSEYYKMCEDEDEGVHDRLFLDAGRFVIEKGKASIGLIQRNFKIGFNHASKIMDELQEAGVVGEQEGTEPRKVLMNMEEFEKYIKENA